MQTPLISDLYHPTTAPLASIQPSRTCPTSPASLYGNAPFYLQSHAHSHTSDPFLQSSRSTAAKHRNLHAHTEAPAPSSSSPVSIIYLYSARCLYRDYDFFWTGYTFLRLTRHASFCTGLYRTPRPSTPYIGVPAP